MYDKEYNGPKNFNRGVEIYYKHQKKQNSQPKMRFMTFKTYNSAIDYISKLSKYSKLIEAWQFGLDKQGRQKYKISISAEQFTKYIGTIAP